MQPRPLFNQQCSKYAVFPAAHAHVIRSHSEAIEIAQRLTSEFAKGAVKRNGERLLPFAEVEALSQSGLLAMNVPCDYGGAWGSYAIVAEVFAIPPSADPNIGQIPQSPVGLINLIRFKPEQDARSALHDLALSGRRFTRPLIWASHAPPLPAPSNLCAPRRGRGRIAARMRLMKTPSPLPL